MLYQGNLLSKTLVIGIIILFIGMSVVSSTDNTVEDVPDYRNHLESVDNSEELIFRGKTAYAYIAYSGSSGEPEGPCFFGLDYPGDITGFSISGFPYARSSTWTNDGKWLVCNETGALWEINLCDGIVLKIGGGGIFLYGLSYDPVNEKLYGSSGSDLYEIDIDTGKQTYIGGFGSGNGCMDISFDEDGILYGCDILTDSLWTINTETGEATLVGPLGVWFVYAVSGHFDFETDTLYLIGFTGTSGELYKCNEDTGECILVDNIEGGAELCALAIPYTDDFCPPNTTHTLDPPEPDGENGWYVNDITVTLNATDDMSGVKEIRYTINGGAEQVIPGSNGKFVLTQDGNDIPINYWAIDNAGNVESPNTILPLIDMDQTSPYTRGFYYEITGGNQWQGWDFLFTLNVTDAMSEMDRVEFRIGNVLQETVYGPGPEYQWGFRGYGILRIEISATAFDNAGNSVVEVEPHDKFRHISHNQPKMKQQSLTFLFLRLIERFPLLEVFLRAMNQLR